MVGDHVKTLKCRDVLGFVSLLDHWGSSQMCLSALMPGGWVAALTKLLRESSGSERPASSRAVWRLAC